MKTPPVVARCAVCGTEFRIWPHEAGKVRYCSRTCSANGRRATQESRFWASVDRRGNDECWGWRGRLDKDGYGAFSITDDEGKRKDVRAHRLAYALAHGGEAAVGCVLHTCDNRPCCNPHHLYEGTRLDNARDCLARGRQPNRKGTPGAKGERNGSARLTEDDVRDIRRRVAGGEPQKDLARAYGVSKATVCNIVSRDTWKHV